jgi:hypothetical protein
MAAKINVLSPRNYGTFQIGRYRLRVVLFGLRNRISQIKKCVPVPYKDGNKPIPEKEPFLETEAFPTFKGKPLLRGQEKGMICQLFKRMVQ